MAVDALIDHRARFNHKEGSGPISVYKCDHCDGWHFSSKGLPHPALSDPNRLKEYKKLNETYYWEQKLKR
jgi:hypothetical protein